MRTLSAIILVAMIPFGAMAQDIGDAKAGERAFKKCQACHVVRAPDGELFAGRSGRTGPNLYGILGSPAASVEDFRYQRSIKEAAEVGLTWTAENLAAYLLDPSGFLKETLDNSSARSAMTFRLRKVEDAQNIVAFLSQFAPSSEGASN